jgi:hypothetical protein
MQTQDEHEYNIEFRPFNTPPITVDSAGGLSLGFVNAEEGGVYHIHTALYSLGALNTGTTQGLTLEKRSDRASKDCMYTLQARTDAPGYDSSYMGIGESVDPWTHQMIRGDATLSFHGCTAGDVIGLGFLGPDYYNGAPIPAQYMEYVMFSYRTDCAIASPPPPPPVYDHGGLVRLENGKLMSELDLRADTSSTVGVPHPQTGGTISAPTDPSTHVDYGTYFLCFADKNIDGVQQFASTPTGSQFTLYKHVVVHVHNDPPSPPPLPKPSPPPPSPHPPPYPTGCVCENTCKQSGGSEAWPNNANGVCEDGGSESSYSVCDLGHDCADCGLRSCTEPPPPSAPLVCEHGVNMFCLHNEYASSNLVDAYYYQELPPNNEDFCEDGITSGIGYPNTEWHFERGTDCHQCGARCCNGDCSTATSDTSCPCYAYVPPSPPPSPPPNPPPKAPPNPPPPAPLHSCGDFQTRWHEAMQRAYDYFHNPDTSSPGSIQFASPPAHISGLSGAALELRMYHDYAFSRQCSQNIPDEPYNTQHEAICNGRLQQYMYKTATNGEWWDEQTETYTPAGTVNKYHDKRGRFRFCEYQFWQQDNGVDLYRCHFTYDVHADHTTVPSILSPKGTNGESGFRSTPTTGSSTIFCDASGTDDGAITLTIPNALSVSASDPFEGGDDRGQNTDSALLLPPSPPHAPCADTLVDMAATVAGCTADGTRPGSDCSNVYDGVVGGYQSIATMGGDLQRSWVVSDVSEAKLDLMFKHPIDFNTIYVTQRLYNGLGDQVREISLVTYDSQNSINGIEHGVVLYTAQQALAQGEAFVSPTRLSRTYGGVLRVELFLDRVDDSDDAGIEELFFSHRCESPPPPPPSPLHPPPSPGAPPRSPPSQPNIATVVGSISGEVRSRTWPGGVAGSDSHTAYECATHCGTFASNDEFSFYSGAGALPDGMYHCECYRRNRWSVLDGSPLSNFVHGRAVGTGGSVAVLLSTMRIGSFVNVEDGHVVPFSDHIAASSEFAISVTVRRTNSLSVGFGNVLRIAPWRLRSECRPCIDASSSQVRVVYYSGEAEGGAWYKAAVATYSLAANTEYTVLASLHNRRLELRVHMGQSTSGALVAENSVGMNMAGRFPRFERLAVYAGSSGSGNMPIATGMQVKPSSVVVEDTLGSHKHFAFSFDDASDLLANSVKFAMGFEGPALAQGNSLPVYAPGSPNAVTSTANGYSGRAAVFDKFSILVLNVEEDEFDLDGTLNSGITICLWMRPTSPIDTLFTTLAGYGATAVLHYYAYFSDVSMSIDGTDTRAQPRSSGELSGVAPWDHFCGSSALGGKTRLYRNGVRVGVRDSGMDLPTEFQGRFAIGASSDLSVYNQTGNDRGFGGHLDEVIVWGRQLSDAEIAQVHGA